MARYTLVLVVSVLAIFAATAAAQGPVAPYGQGEAVGGSAVGAFYDALVPYGNWVYTNKCGWVWYPYDVSVDWRPYTNGQWDNSDAGWTFVSNDPWGWAVYHYGRWYYDDVYGWVWCPGLEWAPSWVAWRTGDDYVGWAPIPPSIPWDDNTGLVTAGIDYDAVFPASSWCFVPFDDFLAPNCDDFLILGARNVTIFGFTTFFFGFDFDRDHHQCFNRFRDEDGFERRFEQRTGHHIDHFRLSDSREPGEARAEGDQLRVFRPDLHTREGLDAARQIRLGAKPPMLESRQEDQRRTLEAGINAHRNALSEAQRNELAHPPQGITPEQIQARHQSESREFDSEAQAQRRLLGNMHSREDLLWTAPATRPQQHYEVAPQQVMPREMAPREIAPAPSREIFPQPVYQHRSFYSTPPSGGEVRGGEIRGGEIQRGGPAGEAGGGQRSQDGGGHR